MISSELALVLNEEVEDVTAKYISKDHLDTLRHLVDKWMHRLASSWTQWEFYSFNGGFFIAPTTQEYFDISISGNFFSQRVCRKTTGIIVCLYALVELMYQTQSERLLDLYESIIEFSKRTTIADTVRYAID
ncbi:antirestriction protein [Pseudoalteromonas sp. Of11M-6]|uniref:antirestriction protein n=1 Tax=Pseudoalteromonas sp. Of11M-6 TaxID=2917754 RepID=UPI001EF5B08A|nr:antirestriction protein [Pseudoalteromonas sp. Of11M-6]MCG7556053.1 antirestriction protein [Pseudoalteromonas sp. Of11M-6]